MWLAAGSWQCISEEFKEISRVWGFEIAGEKQTNLKENLTYNFIAPAGATQEKVYLHFLLSTSYVSSLFGLCKLIVKSSLKLFVLTS